jgi:hypothetical protein
MPRHEPRRESARQTTPESRKRLRCPGLLLVAAACLLVSGCGSTRIVDIDTIPTGASIYVDGEKKGVTRSSVPVDFGSSARVFIQIVKHRYKPISQYWTIDDVPQRRVFPLEVD